MFVPVSSGSLPAFNQADVCIVQMLSQALMAASPGSDTWPAPEGEGQGEQAGQPQLIDSILPLLSSITVRRSMR